MTVFVVAQLTFKDIDAYRRYQAAFPQVFARFGGQVLAADEAPRAVEGGWRPDKVVLMSFPDAQAFDTFAKSEDYRRICIDRDQGANTQAVVIQGLEPPFP